MTWEALEQRAWYQYKRLWIGLGVAACLIVLALPHVQRFYRQWDARRHLHRAETALAAGDLQSASLESRVALSYDPKNVEALKSMARIEETGGSPYAVFFRRQVDALQPDLDNTLSLVQDCLATGDLKAAEEELKRVKPADEQNARYYDLAASIAVAGQDPAKAEPFLAKAVELAPKEDEYRLKLLSLRLDSRAPETRAEALRQMNEMSENSPRRLVALRILLADAKATGDSARAYRLAEKLAGDPQAVLGDKLLRLSTLREVKTTEFNSFSALEAKKKFYDELAQIQLAVANRPTELLALMTWMNRNDLALSVVEWAEKLPADLTTKPPASIAVAEAYVKTSNWKGLKAKLEKASWQKFEYLRLAYFAEALARLNDAGAPAAWHQATEAAGKDPQSIETLGQGALDWDEPAKAEEVLWKRAALDHCPRWVTDRLWSAALKRGDTERLQKVSKLVLQAEPKSVDARNNYIGLSLLTARERDVAVPMAAALYKENPANPHAAGTYALSLYLQGRAEEAAAILDALPAEQLSDPQTALYRGIFLAAAGKTEEAAPCLLAGQRAPTLPEEKAMGDFYRLVCETRADAVQGNESAAAQGWKTALDMAAFHPDWMEWLGAMASRWGWQEKAEKVALEISAHGVCPAWAMGPLWSAAVKSGDSMKIYNAAKLIAAADANSTEANGRYLLVSLLLRRQLETVPRLVAQLHKEDPAQPETAAACGLTLVQQGKAGEAVAVMQRLDSEILRQPRPALFLALFLASAGEKERAESTLVGASEGQELPEEKTLFAMLHQAIQARGLAEKGEAALAESAWQEAIETVQARTDWLELLGRIALAWKWPDEAETALWRCTARESCPRWVIDYLQTAAERRADSGQLLKLSHLLCVAEPGNVAFRNRSLALALLTASRETGVDQAARTLHEQNPGDAEVASTYALSLLLKGRAEEAVQVFASYRQEQLHTSPIALYYGIALASAGHAEKAAEYLQIGAAAARLPEEKALLEKANAAASLRSAHS